MRTIGNAGVRGPVQHTPKRKDAPIDPRVLTDALLAVHCQALYARLDTGYGKCEQQADPAKRLVWEDIWLALLAEYERAVAELRARKMGE